MSTETIQHGSEATSTEVLAAGSTAEGASQRELTSEAAPGRSVGRRRLLIGAGIVALVVALAFGIPWIRFVLSTVSTDDAFVNGHVTFVAPRVHGEVARILVDDNNRGRKGDLLVELDKEPYRDAVA